MSPWKRTYWAVWFANLIAAVGMMSFLPFFPSIVEGLGLSDRADVALWSGLCFGAAPLMAGLMGPFWGAFGDRFGRKLMVLRSMLALTVFVGLMSFARTPAELLLLRACQGLFSGFLPPSITLVSVHVPNERQGRVAGSLQMAMAAGAIAGPMLGGYLVTFLTVDQVFLVVSALTGVGALAVAVFAKEQRTDEEREGTVDAGSLLQGLARDLAALCSNPRTRAAIVLLFVTQFGVGSTNPQLELFVRDLAPQWFGLSQEGLTGLLFTAGAIAGLVAMPLWGRFGDRAGHLRALVLAALGSAVALALGALAPEYPHLLAARVVLMGAAAAMGPCAFALVAAETEAHRRGASFGGVFAARTFAMATAAGAGGALTGWLGIRGLFWAAAIALGTASAFGLVMRWRHRPRASRTV